jgi:hypothetical protein
VSDTTDCWSFTRTDLVKTKFKIELFTKFKIELFDFSGFAPRLASSVRSAEGVTEKR